MTLKFLTSVTLVSALAYATPCQAQSTGSDKDALLQEVRLLRQTLETLVGTSARVQIVFGRLQLQDQRTATTARRLEDVRGALSKLVNQVAQATDNLQRYEAMDLNALEPNERQAVPMRIRALKADLQVFEAERLRLATQETDAANQLALEQNTWSDLNRSLDELEKSLTQPRKQ